MKYLYLMILAALFMPQTLYSDNIWTLDNKEYRHAFFVKATEEGLVFKHQGKLIIFKPEELKPASRQMYSEVIKAYEKIVRTKSKKAQRKFNADLNAIEGPDPIKRLQALAELKKDYTSKKFATVKLDFQKWENTVLSTFEEYEKNIMQMAVSEAITAFRKQQNQFPKLDLITEKVTALGAKLNGMLENSFPQEMEKLKTEPIDVRISHGEKMLEVYKDIVSDFTELNSVIAEAKKELPVWTALKNSKSSKKHAKEIANLEKLISTYPQHPQVADLHQIKEFHQYNLQVRKDLNLIVQLAGDFRRDPERIVRIAQKAAKAYSDSIYAPNANALLANINKKWDAEKVRIEEERARAREAEAAARAERARLERVKAAGYDRICPVCNGSGRDSGGYGQGSCDYCYGVGAVKD